MSVFHSFTLAGDITWDCELSVLPGDDCDLLEVFGARGKDLPNRFVSEAGVYRLFWELPFIRTFLEICIPTDITGGYVYVMQQQQSNGQYSIGNNTNDNADYDGRTYLCAFECGSGDDCYTTELSMHVSLSKYRLHSNVYKFKNKQEAIKLCKEAFVIRKAPEIL